MPRRIAISMLNASTMDILNTIHANAPYDYQMAVPKVENENDIPRVGEVLYGYPAMANQFLNSLVNRIALTRVKSAVFNNAYAQLKKGYLEFGETVQEVFVNIAKAREFNAEKAEARELKRSVPDVRTAFHVMNWRAQYPVTIQQDDLRMAFTSINGVQDLIAKIVDSVYTAAEYDEYLLFKYLLIKAISHGKMKPVSIGVNMDEAAVAFRSASNKMTFMKKDFNAAGVTTATPKSEQYIFMDSDYNARYDVNVLAGAFNMDKADFIGKLMLIDDWTSFDNERFDEIRANSDMIEEVTENELALMQFVKGVLVDGEWFQVYDNNTTFTEKFVASGSYWNYFYNVWKTVSSSPFSNAVVFLEDPGEALKPAPQLTFVVTNKASDEDGNAVMAFELDEPHSFINSNWQFLYTTDTANMVGINRYGSITFPANVSETMLGVIVNGVVYKTTLPVTKAANVGDTFVFADM